MKATVSWEYYLSSPQSDSSGGKLNKLNEKYKRNMGIAKFQVLNNLLVVVVVVVVPTVAEKGKEVVHPKLHVLDPVSTQGRCCQHPLLLLELRKMSMLLLSQRSWLTRRMRSSTVCSIINL